MSSMLALAPGPAFMPSRHPYAAGSQPVLPHESGEHHSQLQHGLPTPPNTVMSCRESYSKAVWQTSYRSAHEHLPAYPNICDQQPHTAVNAASQVPVLPPTNPNAYSTAPPKDPARPKQQPQQEIAAHLQIPQSINSSRGSLPELAAQITSLFWFETSETLEYAENLPESSPTKIGLNEDAHPSVGFSKWVTTIVSTTQVARNVVLLALLFIYRLKKFNPSVSGKRGSEYRLLTIALMLGNKFLDDNTYTNKTWAEVSGISVNEIHIMEVEFLSNMRYELYASLEQWQEWKAKLGRLSSFYEKASLLVKTPKATSPVTPITQSMTTKLPSPPSRNHSSTTFIPSPDPIRRAHHLSQSPAKTSLGSLGLNTRKRSLDTTIDLPPAKRIHPVAPNGASAGPLVYVPSPAQAPTVSTSASSFGNGRLPPLPATLPIPVNHSMPYLAPLNLPGGGRAMSSVYPGVSTTIAPVSQALPALPPTNGHIMPANAGSRPPSHPGSTNTSPVNFYGPHTPTHHRLSPGNLMWRGSPYRPVTNMNTLLYPPPSGAFSNAVKPINFEQMHYQPLSKTAMEPRQGPIQCLQPDAWMSHANTPIHRPF